MLVNREIPSWHRLPAIRTSACGGCHIYRCRMPFAPKIGTQASRWRTKEDRNPDRCVTLPHLRRRHTGRPCFHEITTGATLRPMKIETLAVHAGHTIDAATGAVATPIYLSTTFERDVEGTYSRGHMYTRNSNPNRQMLETGIAALEGGAAAAAFGSGMAAATTILQALNPT